jgi:anti-anti-sigma regulatory factor
MEVPGMSSNLYTLNYLQDDKILHLKFSVANIDKDTAAAIYDSYTKESNLPDFSDFIMDASSVTEISDPGIGILMKAMGMMKKAKGYLVIVMTEEFLQKIMVAHPEMFNYMAVFHSLDEAKAYIKKSKK